MSDTGDLEAVETEESSGETEDEPPEVSEDDPDTEERTAADDRAHLEDVEDGCGCAEVWEHLSEQRDD